MAATKKQLSRRVVMLERALADLLASHRDYTESHARNMEQPNSGWPALEWAKDVEQQADVALHSVAK